MASAAEPDYHSLVEQLPAVPYIETPDEDQRVVYVGPQIESILGISRDAYLSDPTTWDRHIHPEDHERATREYAEAIRRRGAFALEYRMVRSDGTVIWVRDEGSTLFDGQGRPCAVQGILQDVSSTKLVEERLRRHTDYLAALHETALAAMRRLDVPDLLRTMVARAAELASTPHGYAYVLRDDGETLDVETGVGMFVDWIGHTLKVGEGVGGRVVESGRVLMVEDYDAWPGRSGQYPTGMMGAVVGVPVTSGDRVTGAIGLARAPGEPPFTEDDVARLVDFAEIASLSLDNARLHAAALEELRQRQEAEEKFQFLAFHDPLTGLPNRAMFEELLQVAVARARRARRALAVLFMDLDNFKLVNDSLGHAAGDELLTEAARRVRESVREADVVARQGGDEFLILLEDLDAEDAGHPGDVVANCEAVVARIEESLRPPVRSAGIDVYTTASIGISLFPFHAEDAPTLLRYADAAMYSSKRAGPGRHHIFVRELADSETKLSFTTRLRRAVEQAEWTLHYQPIVDLNERRLWGVEALIRWRQPDGSLVLPARFIPLVEEMGLIGELGAWVLAEASQQTRVWQDQGLDIFTSFNLSLGELWQTDVASRIAGHVRDSGVDPSAMVVEITESSAVTDLARTERVLRELKAAGLTLAIDDFGTGQSSLSRLKHLPADMLKIDQSFLVGVPEDPGATSMIRAIVEIGRSLGMEAVAEGVETAAQHRFFVQSECRLAQGFHYARPMLPHEILDVATTLDLSDEALLRDSPSPAPR